MPVLKLPKKSTVVWFVSSLEQKGGGERFVLETSAALRTHGHEVSIVCDRLHENASFDGQYDLSDVLCIQSDHQMGRGYITQIREKISGLWGLYRILRNLKPDMVVCQSEYDAIKVYLLSWLLSFKYRSFVFGQMYQFPDDISRYARVFRKHLRVIVASRPGYSKSVKMPPPQLPIGEHILNEFVAWLKYRAHIKADRIFCLSEQVAWEVSLLYGRPAVVARAAFDAAYIDQSALASPRPVKDPIRLVSVSRLVTKKRVDLMIAAFDKVTKPSTLTIIGTGYDEARLKALAANSARSKDIKFLGTVSDERLHAEIGAADCLLSLDIGDYDISVVEALGRGLRAIVANDFDLESFGPSFTGIVSVAADVEILASAIDNIPNMSPPSVGNLSTLKDQTWQSLAQKVSAN